MLGWGWGCSYGYLECQAVACRPGDQRSASRGSSEDHASARPCSGRRSPPTTPKRAQAHVGPTAPKPCRVSLRTLSVSSVPVPSGTCEIDLVSGRTPTLPAQSPQGPRLPSAFPVCPCICRDWRCPVRWRWGESHPLGGVH